MKHQNFCSSIELNKLHLLIHLGVSPKERREKQSVEITLKLFFSFPPKACYTDDINDTVCYYELAEKIRDYCTAREFKLIEYLCMEIYNLVQETILPEIKISVQVDKCAPPVKDLRGPTSFIYNDIE